MSCAGKSLLFPRYHAEKSKDAAESLADLKAQIAQSKEVATGHKYVRAGRGERRSALYIDPLAIVLVELTCTLTNVPISEGI